MPFSFQRLYFYTTEFLKIIYLLTIYNFFYQKFFLIRIQSHASAKIVCTKQIERDNDFAQFPHLKNLKSRANINENVQRFLFFFW
jgi:hypothetical protein